MLGYHQSFLKPMAEVVWGAGDRLTFQVFTRNARNMKQRYISDQEIAQFNFVLLKSKIRKYVVHAPYAMNPSSPRDEVRKRAVQMIQDDMDFMAELAGEKFYVLHPGSHLGVGRNEGIRNLANTLNQVDNYGIDICIEMMAGGGTEVLFSPEDLEFARVVTRRYFTFDTAHVFQAGYDPHEIYEKYKELFHVVHLNNSATLQGSKHDIHANIQYGKMDPFYLKEFYESVPQTIPTILETPYEHIEDDYLFLKN